MPSASTNQRWSFIQDEADELSAQSQRFKASRLVWIVVSLEHGILFLRLLMRALVSDVPSWVPKAGKVLKFRTRNVIKSPAEKQADAEEVRMKAWRLLHMVVKPLLSTFVADIYVGGKVQSTTRFAHSR